MEEIEHSNKVKILKELQKNGRATLSELAEKTGLSRQTVSKTIDNMERKKQIWGYTTIFNPELIGKKEFIFLAKLDLSSDTEDIIKKVTNAQFIKNNEEIYEFKTSVFLHGTSDLFISILAKNIIDAKKLMNNFKKLFPMNIKQIDLLEEIATFRSNYIRNPNMKDEWYKILP